MDNKHFIAVLVTLFVAIFGGLVWQTHQLDQRLARIVQRLASTESRMDRTQGSLSQRIDQFEKNFNARFADFKQEMRAARK